MPIPATINKVLTVTQWRAPILNILTPVAAQHTIAKIHWVGVDATGKDTLVYVDQVIDVDAACAADADLAAAYLVIQTKLATLAKTAGIIT